MSAPVLIVEGDRSIADSLHLAFRREGFEDVRIVSSGSEASTAIDAEEPGIVVLDLDLPDAIELDGAAAGGAGTKGFPVLFITDGDCDSRTLAAFHARLEDCMGKPVDPDEAVARARSLLRRTRTPAARPLTEVYDFVRFQIVPDEGRLVVDGMEIPIPAREFELLTFLASRAGVPQDANELYRRVWGAEPLGSCDQNTVSVHVHRLRERIEPEPGKPQYLVTVRGHGYKLQR